MLQKLLGTEKTKLIMSSAVSTLFRGAARVGKTLQKTASVADRAAAPARTGTARTPVPVIVL